MMSLTVISVDRFLGVQFPLRRIITYSRAKKIIGFIWLLAFLAMSPKLYGVRAKNRNDNLVCFTSWDPFPKNTNMIMLIIQVVVFHVTPLCIMAVLYSITARKLWVRRIPGNVTEANQRLEHKTKVNVLKMCITVVVVFAFCWIPLYTVMVVSYTNVLVCPIPRKVTDVLFFLSLTSYAINPLIYFIFSKDYRNGFWDIFKPLLASCKPSLRPPISQTMEITDIRSSGMSILYDNEVKLLILTIAVEQRKLDFI
ncbi:Neuromedin-K receptor [Exaiptasia diaphana]|nr:Neuromedin-K receptor [Exaiptasia diaphana]